MAIALVTSASAAGSNGGTTGAINTSGSTLLVACISSYIVPADATISDSQGNTWTSLTKWAEATVVYTRLFYVLAPSTSSSHTFTVSSTAGFSVLSVLAFSGTATSSAFDQQNGNTASTGTTLQAGITPTVDNEVVVFGLGLNASSSTPTISIAGGFTVQEFLNYSGGNNFGGALAFQIQTTAAPSNPQWNFSNSTQSACAIASFKATAATVENMGWNKYQEYLETSQGIIQRVR